MANFFNDPYAGYPITDPYAQQPISTQARAQPGPEGASHSARPTAAERQRYLDSLAPVAEVHRASAPQEAQARKAGFANYAAMIAWQRNAANKFGGTVGNQNHRGEASIGAGVSAANGMTPRSILSHVADAYARATGQ